MLKTHIYGYYIWILNITHQESTEYFHMTFRIGEDSSDIKSKCFDGINELDYNFPEKNS